MSRAYDAIVVGLGAIGAATAYRLAKQGASVLGIDRFTPPHDRGSTHGETRITRVAVGEGARYVPYVKRSHELWRELEEESGESLMTQCGMLMIGGARPTAYHGADDFLEATIDVANEHDVPHETPTATEVATRFPQFALQGDERGFYFEPGAGFVRPERAVATQLELAKRHGAELRFGERVDTVAPGRVGDDTAETVIVAAGPWIGDLVEGDFTVHRQVQFWFESRDPDLHAEMPIFVWDLGRGPDDFFYGFPTQDGRVKVASEDHTTTTTADACAREVTADEKRAIETEYLEGRVRHLGPCVKASTCLYTVTPDRHFAVGDEEHGLITVSACSGHGFKHSPALGEELALRVAKSR
ncbi:MAG TPA: N-methyl-L-tryptophan oxidase [Solirubrobacteraceae bacterium]